MKKLTLKSTFSRGEVLSRAQLKKVLGGSGSSSLCSTTCNCPTGESVSISMDCPGCTATAGVEVACSNNDFPGITSNTCQIECLKYYTPPQ